MLLPLMQPAKPTYGFDALRNAVLPDDWAFTRASSGTYFNADGNLVTAANNEPRFEYDPVTLAPLGLLMEGQRTNLLLTSSTLTGIGWAGTNSTLTPGQAGSPDGLNTFNLFRRNSTAASHRQYNIDKAASSLPFSLFFDVKKGSGKYFAIRLQGAYPNRTDAQYNLDTGVAGTATSYGTGFAGVASMRYIGNGVYRCFLSSPTTDAHTRVSGMFSFNDNSVQIDGTDTTGNTTGYVTDGQLEQGTSASSYIPTTSTAVTRAADSLYTTTIPWFNASAGTTLLTACVDYFDVGGPNYLCHLSDGTLNNFISSFVAGGTKIPQGRLTVSGSYYTSAGSIGALTEGGCSKLALSYRAGTNLFAVNGVVGGAGDGTFGASAVPSGITTISLGNRPSGSYFPAMHIQGFKYWNRSLSAAELQRITT